MYPRIVLYILQSLLNTQERAKNWPCTTSLLYKACYMSRKAYTCAHTQVEKLALEKWGGQDKLDAERAKRHEKRLDRERAKAGMTMHFLHAVIFLMLENVCSLLSCPDLTLAIEDWRLPLSGRLPRMCMAVLHSW